MKNTPNTNERVSLVQVTATRINNQTKEEKVEKATAKTLKIRPFAIPQTATVGSKKGVTLSTGNFESMRIDVFVSTPCYCEELVEVYEQISKLTDDLLVKEVEEFRGGSDG